MSDLKTQLKRVIEELELRRSKSSSNAVSCPKMGDVFDGQKQAYTVALSYLRTIANGEPCPIR